MSFTYTKIEEAKSLLKEAGYFTDNLWHVNDVQRLVKHINDDDAQEVLEQALTNDATMEQIWFAITFAIREMNLKLEYNE